jgi:hypothetical protein
MQTLTIETSAGSGSSSKYCSRASRRLASGHIAALLNGQPGSRADQVAVTIVDGGISPEWDSSA